MGLYSTNRVSSVTESSESSDALIESMDWTPDFSIGSVMEAVIQIHENDAKMFDSLIECDFISANNNSIMNEAEAEEANNSANETKANKIGDKIHAIIEAIKNFIQKAASNFIAKIVDLTKSDKKIYDTYKDVLKIENLKDFEGIKDFRFPKTMLNSDNIKSIDNVKNFSKEFVDKITRSDDIESIKDTYGKFETKCNEEVESFEKLEEESFEAATTWKPSETWQIKRMLESVSTASSTIKEIKQTAAKTIAALKEFQASCKKAKIGIFAKKKAGDVEVYKMKTLYDIASKTTQLFSKEFGVYTRTATKQIAACRKATILCGRAAKKAVKGEDVNKTEENVNQESATMYVLGESSDAYVYECLAY